MSQDTKFGLSDPSTNEPDYPLCQNCLDPNCDFFGQDCQRPKCVECDECGKIVPETEAKQFEGENNTGNTFFYFLCQTCLDDTVSSE